MIFGRPSPDLGRGASHRRIVHAGWHDQVVTEGSRPRRGRLWARRPEIWESRSDVERIAFFSDAVFAIAMTLLVVQLSVPHGPAGQLGHALRARGPKYFAFALSFLVIAQYWMAHHRVFRHIRRYDLGLLWLNLLWLLAIAFLPFPTAVLGNYSHSRLAGVFYGLSLFVPSAIGTVLWFYCRRRGLLGEVPERTRRQIQTRGIATPVVFLVSAGAALVNVRLAFLCWVALLPLTRLFLSVWIE
jgi:uncharacterized membrane protein